MELGALLLLFVLVVLYLLVGIMMINLAGLDLLLWDWYTNESLNFFNVLLRLLCWPYVIYNHFNR